METNLIIGGSMKKLIVSIITLAALIASSMSFAWDRDDGWRHHDGYRGGYREEGFVGHHAVRTPYVIAGIALGTAGAIAYSSTQRPYYEYSTRPYYAPQPIIIQQPPIYYQQPYAVSPPPPYGYRPY
jgi:hypothetical protein